MTRLTRTRSAILCTALAALAATGLSACKGSANTTSAGGGTLTIQGDAGNPTLVENFNPLVTATELGGARLMYEPLEIASPIDGKYTPFLATGYKFTDPKTLVYTIRQGVKWSDGKDFTPADVVFTFQLLKKFPALDSNGVWNQIAGVATSGNDVTVTFKEANVPFAGVVAATPIVPQHLWSTVPDPVKYANTKPVGTGPFTLDKFAPTQYTLKKNASYWQADKIAPKAVVFPAQSSNQSTNQLDVTSGKFDWAYNFLPDVKKTFVAKDPKHNIYWFPPGGVIGLYLNLTKAPYSDVNFRKGVSLSLNRSTIAKKAVNGYLDQASMSGLILPNLDKWLDSSLPDKGVVSQNAAAAKAAFAQAGYTSKGGKLVGADGKQATMTISMPTNFSDWVAAAKEVSTQLSAMGIKVNLDLPQFAAYQSSIQSGKFDAAIGGYGGTGTPYNDFNNALNSSFATPVGTTTSNNFQRFKDPTVDSALSTLAAATDETAQQQATKTLEQVMYTKLPVVLMYYGGSWGLFSTKNFTGWPSADDPYTLPTSYNNAVLVVVTHLKKA
ncbi:MAG: peptide/nickel transport system substrate-binding protein [Pseudonocardiales bacterium]|jgi:peptide/nickel transport system substrate-binding protein|nr:putative peptide transporter substrate binding component [Pseudonocardiales bacterium]MDT4961004.1 peptide/nickel transport system substrate-binding protein [Pseudonocardiales bacterium]MDT4970218.1 peptide/nickel transport system substrate-binding protein [Pseudonocardiales bacterium]MDT4974404.1 peptide/nickel transport system substrate-binding protein [Pseudonocardiales bacterium]MDT4978506.1 peptide/nickel transport system substrate-binding protein [Pseudonocardiales bacterium]